MSISMTQAFRTLGVTAAGDPPHDPTGHGRGRGLASRRDRDHDTAANRRAVESDEPKPDAALSLTGLGGPSCDRAFGSQFVIRHTPSHHGPAAAAATCTETFGLAAGAGAGAGAPALGKGPTQVPAGRRSARGQLGAAKAAATPAARARATPLPAVLEVEGEGVGEDAQGQGHLHEDAPPPPGAAPLKGGLQLVPSPRGAGPGAELPSAFAQEFDGAGAGDEVPLHTKKAGPAAFGRKTRGGVQGQGALGGTSAAPLQLQQCVHVLQGPVTGPGTSPLPLGPSARGNTPAGAEGAGGAVAPSGSKKRKASFVEAPIHQTGGGRGRAGPGVGAGAGAGAGEPLMKQARVAARGGRGGVR